MSQFTMYVGLDVHKDSVDIALAAEGRGEVRPYGRVAGDLDAVDKAIRRISGRHPKLDFAYEAGPCGYALYRHLTKRGYPCSVVAPGLIPKRASDRIKTDRRDAMALARLHRAGELTAVYVPDASDEAIRDMTRCREDAVIAHKRARQQLLSMLLRLDVRYTGKTAWTNAHRRWLADLKMPHPEQQIVFQEYVDAIQQTHERIDRLEAQLIHAAQTWRMKPVFEALQGLRGVSVIVAAGLLAELGDLSRFDNPRQLMAFLGLVPSQDSSGPRQRLGSITKSGNGHARRLLVEAAWSYRYSPKVGRRVQKRLEDLPPRVREISWKAQLRLCRRFRRLSAKGKHVNVVVTAIARELLGFVWAIAKEVKPMSS